MNSRYAAIIVGLSLAATPLMAAVEPPEVTNMGNVVGGDVKAAHTIIQQKCTRCHSDQVIDAAISANKDMLMIQRRMENKGANLNANEREVLGIYWKQQNPLKKDKQK